MKTHPEHGGVILTTEQDLDGYLKDELPLPRHFFHFLENPSLKNRYSVIFPIYDKKSQMVVCSLYFAEKRNQIATVENAMSLKEEGPIATLRYGCNSLTNLTATQFKQAGDAFEFDYSKPRSLKQKKKIKYMYVVYGFEGKMEENEEMLPAGPNGLPVWIHISLLPLIFEPMISVPGRPARSHPQYLPYLRLMEWISKESPSEDLSKVEVERWK